MKRINPSEFYRNEPCSVVAIGCALSISSKSDLEGLRSHFLREDGYLSLSGMNSLLRANMGVSRQIKFKRGERPLLRDFLRGNTERLIICVEGHFLYAECENYYSFFWNGKDPVVSAWYLK